MGARLQGNKVTFFYVLLSSGFMDGCYIEEQPEQLTALWIEQNVCQDCKALILLGKIY